MVRNALLKPASIEARKVFSNLNSSFILSKIRILASTAIPIVRIIPAIPGKVKVAFRPAKAPTISTIHTTKAKSAINPNPL